MIFWWNSSFSSSFAIAQLEKFRRFKWSSGFSSWVNLILNACRPRSFRIIRSDGPTTSTHYGSSVWAQMDVGGTVGQGWNLNRGSTTTARSTPVTGSVMTSTTHSSLGTQNPLQASDGCRREKERKSSRLVGLTRTNNSSRTYDHHLK